jgi:hypothetical protein
LLALHLLELLQGLKARAGHGLSAGVSMTRLRGLTACFLQVLGFALFVLEGGLAELSEDDGGEDEQGENRAGAQAAGQSRMHGNLVSRHAFAGSSQSRGRDLQICEFRSSAGDARSVMNSYQIVTI